MLNIDYVKSEKAEDLRGKQVLSTIVKWQQANMNINTSRNAPQLNVGQYEGRIRDSYIKISCNDNEYISIPRISNKPIQYLTSSDSNYKKEDMGYYDSNPSILYINLNERLVPFIKSDTLTKMFLVYVVNSNNLSVEKYCLTLSLNYKDNGTVDTPYYDIDVDVSKLKIYDRNTSSNLAAILFLSVIITWIYRLFNNSLTFASITMVETTIIFAFLLEYFYRYLYQKRTMLNRINSGLRKLLRYLTKKNIYYYPKHLSERKIKKHLKESSNIKD